MRHVDPASPAIKGPGLVPRLSQKTQPIVAGTDAGRFDRRGAGRPRLQEEQPRQNGPRERCDILFTELELVDPFRDRRRDAGVHRRGQVGPARPDQAAVEVDQIAVADVQHSRRAVRSSAGRNFGVDVFERLVLQPVGTGRLEGVDDVGSALQRIFATGAAELSAAVQPPAAALGVVVRVAANFPNGLASAAEEQKRTKGVDRLREGRGENRFVESEIILPAAHFVAEGGVNLCVARGGAFCSFRCLVGSGAISGLCVSGIEGVSDRGDHAARSLAIHLPVVKAFAFIRKDAREREADDAPHPPAFPERSPFRFGHVPLRGGSA